MEIHHFFYRGIHLTSNCCFSIVMLFFGGVLTYVDIITYLVGIKASRWCFVVPGSRCIRISLSWWNIVAHPKEVAVDEHTKQKLVLSCHFNRKSYHQSLCRHAYGIPKANAPCVLKICSFCYGKRTVERHARFIIYHSFIILLFVAYLDIRIVSVHVFASGSKTVPTKYLFLGFIMFIVVFRPGGHVHPHCLGTYLTHARTLKAFVFKSATQCTECRYILHTCSHLESIRVQSATEWTASVHTLHMPKPNVTRVQSATEWTASVHTLHMPKPNVTRVQSATEWTASVHTLHMPKPNVTRVQSATEWTASVHTLHMPKPNVTRVQSATEWTASVHTLHMPKPNVTRVQSATEWTASVHTLHKEPLKHTRHVHGYRHHDVPDTH